MRIPTVALFVAVLAVVVALVVGGDEGVAVSSCDSLGLAAWSSNSDLGYESPEATLAAVRQYAFPIAFPDDLSLAAAMAAPSETSSHVTITYPSAGQATALLFRDGKLAARATLSQQENGKWSLGTSEQCRI